MDRSQHQFFQRCLKCWHGRRPTLTFFYSPAGGGPPDTNNNNNSLPDPPLTPCLTWRKFENLAAIFWRGRYTEWTQTLTTGCAQVKTMTSTVPGRGKWGVNTQPHRGGKGDENMTSSGIWGEVARWKHDVIRPLERGENMTSPARRWKHDFLIRSWVPGQEGWTQKG